MEEEIGIEDSEHASVREEGFDMLLQAAADYERMVELTNQFLFFCRQRVRIGRIDSREIEVAHLILFPIAHESPAVEVDEFEKTAVIHLPLGMFGYHRSLKLELDDAYCLVHLGKQTACLVVVSHVVRIKMRPEVFAWVIAIDFHGEGSQRHEIDTVAFFESLLSST